VLQFWAIFDHGTVLSCSVAPFVQKRARAHVPGFLARCTAQSSSIGAAQSRPSASPRFCGERHTLLEVAAEAGAVGADFHTRWAMCTATQLVSSQFLSASEKPEQSQLLVVKMIGTRQRNTKYEYSCVADCPSRAPSTCACKGFLLPMTSAGEAASSNALGGDCPAGVRVFGRTTH